MEFHYRIEIYEIIGGKWDLSARASPGYICEVIFWMIVSW